RKGKLHHKGVNIAQFVDRIPEGCSTPDFERKPVTLTLQEGKNAIFRAVVKGVPTPEVKWRRAKGEMDNPDKYEIFFSEVTNEYILKINKLTADDTDVYRCFAINEYGEATCSAGLRIIQVSSRKRGKLHRKQKKTSCCLSKILDFFPLFLRAPAPKQKTIDKEAIFQLLLHADRRDYEKICMKYGISDFRGMLRKLQEMRRDLIHSIKNMEHIKVNKDGTATFRLEMDLKNSNSKIYLLKDGERLRYGTGDEYRKHYLRRIGKRYNFIVNDVQPEDAGVYQVRVEDVPVFSTELDAESIPVRFQQPLRDVRCPEKGNAVFECILRSPCYDAVWLHRTHPLEASEKHQISITPDGLTHQLVIKDVEASDNGMYTLDTGLCSSNAYLLVEVGDKHSLYGKDDKLGRTRSGKNAAGTETAGGMRSPYSKDGLPTHLSNVFFSGHLAPRCHINKQLIDVRVQKGEPAELSCAVNKEDLTGTWFKDGLKLTSMDGVVFEKQGLVHKLIFSKVEDIHAGKYRFEAGDIKTEALIFVEDPPQVDKVLMKNLTSVPTVAKAGENIKIKIPFEGRLPVRATWLKDKMELADDSRIRLDKTDTYTMLSISNTERKDRGDYKVRSTFGSGANLLVFIFSDKPQPPAGPLKILESSANDITIQWKPPKDDGGKPVQSYIVERQEVGKGDWVALAEAPRSCTTFTTNKVERDMSYYFRVRAVNAEGTSDALESEEVKAVSKATPGAPDPPEIISVSKDTITISWKTPRRTGSSRIVGYIVQKRKKGTMTWVPVNSVPIKLKMTDLKKGLQYEFCVAAVNASGVGDISAPSQPVFARDSTKPPGQVRDLAVTSTDSTSVTLTWKRPEAKDGNDVKGYDVEIRSSNNLDWTKCNVVPIDVTTYTVKGLQNKELYFLRVRALNDCGPGEAAELEAFIEANSTVGKFLIDDRVKNFLIIKAGNTIRVDIPFEASPDPEVTWLKDGLLLSNRATISTKDGTSQLLIKAAEMTDSGIYTIELKNGSGKRETFSFQVQVTDIPQNPGPILLQENVPNAVTVTWEPSASEKWESNLYYTVLKRESQKGVWHVVGDLIYTNKFTYTKVIPGRDYYFRVVAKNELGSSGPSETVQPWRIKKIKGKTKYRGVNQNEPPRFLVPLKPHVVTTGSECRMSCAVAGHPPPKITWYKDSRDLSSDPAYFGTNDFGVCSLVIQGVSKADEGEYMVEAANELGRVFSRAFLAIKDVVKPSRQ
uniref:Immunoglobulin superfamily member 22 n=1 Tax=Cairina moschata TaxID=8855 RepID=A0A8C3C192_CAIMO